MSRVIDIEHTKVKEYERKLTGSLTRCPGEAHSPDVGGRIDNCSICAPQWGFVEARERLLTEERARALLAEGYAIKASDLSDEALDAFMADRSVVLLNTTKPLRGGGSVNYNLFAEPSLAL